MFAIKSNIVWLLIILHVSNSQRRIENGTNVIGDKPYVVYLVKAPMAQSLYDSWLCGGALVTSLYVITSAACIKDVDFLYVIAGYKKYVVDKDIDTDPCTSKMKKKVIYTCYPAAYELKYERTDKWAYVDIGIAKVESPYNVSDQTYKTICSYIPGTIPISYEAKDHMAESDAIVLGWGHNSKWRKVTDHKNYNVATLKYASVALMDKEECKKAFEDVGNMADVIEKYMICTNGTGTMDENGEEIKPANLRMKYEKCSKRKSLGYGPEDEEDCEDAELETRREIKGFNHSSNRSTIRNKTILNNKSAVTNRTAASIDRTDMNNRTNPSDTYSKSNKTVVFNETVRASRRNGICQNDHGGPLVAWGGGHEILIGVASVFKVTKDSKCTGPYLYTSTQCTGAFLDCILTQHSFNISHDKGANSDTRRALCKKSAREKGYDTVERHISWLYHPAGAADHEKHLSQKLNKSDENEQVKRRNENNKNLNKNPKNNVNPPINMNPANNMNSTNNMNPTNNMNSAFRDKSSVYVKDAINVRYGTNI